MKTQTSNTIKRMAWLIWITASLFYAIEFFQRVSPTVMANPIMQTLHLDNETFAWIISTYFYAYALSQLPVGYLLDKYGSRYLLAIACFSVSLGSLIFAIGHMTVLLVLSRLLIGAGSAFAFIGVLKLSSHWFSERQYPLMVGLTNTIGVLGAVAGEAPFAELVKSYGWQHSLIAVSLIGFVISVLIIIIVREHPQCLKSKEDCTKALQHSREQSVKKILKEVLRDKQTWVTAIYAGLMVAPIIAFAELWGVPFLSKVYGLSNVNASLLNTLIFIGIAFGGPINGLLATLLNRRKVVMMLGNIMALICLSLVIYGQHYDAWVLGALLFCFGFSTSSMLLAFTINKERHPLYFNATVVGFTNMMIAILGAMYQDITGQLLDHVANTHYALIILPATLLFNLLLLTRVKYVKS